MKKKIITWIILLGLWQMTSLMVNKEVILPLPIDVFKKMIEFLCTPSFYQAVFYTLLRIAISFILALCIGVSLGIISGLNKQVHDYLSPIFTLLQTIPQIGYILILLVWCQSLTALILIVMLMILPIFYHNSVNGMLNIDQDLKDVILLYHHSFWFNLRYAYLPLIRGYLFSAIETCLPMAFKVGVMAEIFVSSRQGIGKQLYFARVQIDMVSLFAWIIWMVILLSLLSLCIKSIMKLFKSYEK